MGLNTWFAAAAEHVLQVHKLTDPLDTEVVNLHNGSYWLDQPVADPNNPDQIVPPPPWAMVEANRHRVIPFYTEKPANNHAAVVAAHRDRLTWVQAFYELRRTLPSNVRVEGRRMGAGGVALANTPTAEDYAAERLSSHTEVINILNGCHPGAERKALRTPVLDRLAKVNTWAEAMLTALPLVVKKDNGVGVEYTAALRTGLAGDDLEFTRRAATGLSLYKLNYLATLAMSRVSGNQTAAFNRAKDWLMASRGKMSHHEWRAKLTELGLQQQPAVVADSLEWKQRFITGSNLGGAKDPFRTFAWKANVNSAERLYEKSVTELTTLLNDILQDQQLAVGTPAPTATKPDGQDKQAKAQGGKASSSGDNGAAAKGQNQRSGAAGTTNDKKPVGDFPGACWNCKEVGHKGVDCPKKTGEAKHPAAPTMSKNSIKKKALVARVAAATAKAVLATQAATSGGGRDPGKRKRAAPVDDDLSSDESEDSPEAALERAAVEAAVKSVLAARKADDKEAKKARKGAAQIRGSKYNNETSD